MTLKLGLNDYITNEEYHDDREFISSSGLKMMLNNPRKFHKEYVLNEGIKGSSNPAFDFGSYVHCAILEPNLLDEEFAIFDGIQKRGKTYEECVSKNEGKTIISRVQAANAQKLIDSFNEAKVVIGPQGHDKEVNVSSFYTGGYAEQTCTAEIDGIKVKVRSDYRKVFDDFASINDIKTTGDNIDTATAAERVCSIYDYDLSAALYVDIFSMVSNLPHDFYFTFLSKKNGETRMYKASEQMLEAGRKKYKKAIELLKEARETGRYYINKIEEINSI
jgi:hypothetical protein